MTTSDDPRWTDAEFAIESPFRRDAEQSLQDARSTAAQAAHLADRAGAAAFHRELGRELGRRAETGETGVAVDQLRRADGDVLVASGELLIRETDYQGTVVDLLATLDLDPGRREPALEGRLVRLVNPDVPAARLADIAQLLRRRGVPASVNHVTPLGPWAKGEGGPEPTTGAAAEAPEPARTGVPVAVIDTGVRSEGRTDGWLRGLETAANRDPLTPLGGDDLLDFAAGHGTSVAGVVQQVAPDADIRVLRALNSDGVGSEVTVAEHLLAAVRDGAGVVCLSLGAQTVDDQPLLALEVALELVDEQDGGSEVLVVAAAGNYGDRRPVWPAAFRRVVSVAGLTATGRRTTWSTRGFWVDLSCVAEGILTPYVEGVESPVLDPDPDRFDGPNPWAVWTGTSFAAPQIAGLVARLTADDDTTPRAALARIARAGIRLPDHGRAVRILPGT